jgi:hypothetical protein
MSAAANRRPDDGQTLRRDIQGTLGAGVPACGAGAAKSSTTTDQ